jgi:hypothetical protein
MNGTLIEGLRGLELIAHSRHRQADAASAQFRIRNRLRLLAAEIEQSADYIRHRQASRLGFETLSTVIKPDSGGHLK